LRRPLKLGQLPSPPLLPLHETNKAIAETVAAIENTPFTTRSLGKDNIEFPKSVPALDLRLDVQPPQWPQILLKIPKNKRK
jgi:hypothetical protein